RALRFDSIESRRSGVEREGGLLDRAGGVAGETAVVALHDQVVEVVLVGRAGQVDVAGEIAFEAGLVGRDRFVVEGHRRGDRLPRVAKRTVEAARTIGGPDLRIDQPVGDRLVARRYGIG